jgi:hypothetical protein
VNYQNVIEGIEAEYIDRICENWEKYSVLSKKLKKEKAKLLRIDFARRYTANRPISAFLKNKELNKINVIESLQEAIDDEIDKYGYTQYVIRDTLARFGIDDDESDEYYEAYEYQCESFRLISKSLLEYMSSGKFVWYKIE